jgi:hypothetical protein
MDPVVLQLLAQMAQAKGGNKNLSGLLGNMDNPLLLALAGVLDPMSMQGAGQTGSLYGQYAGDPNTPDAVKVLMDYVDQGANKYQIESAINLLDPSVVTDSGYTPEQLISMGSDMVKQRSEGADKNVFEKAGFRNPNDVYTAADVPLSAGSQKRLMELQTEYEPIGANLEKVNQRVAKTGLAMRGAGKDRRQEWSDLIMAENTSPIFKDKKLKELAKWIESAGYVSVPDIEKKAQELQMSGKGQSPRLGRAVGKIKQTAASYEQGVGDRAQAIADWEQAKIGESKAKAEESNNLRLREAIVQANLRQAAQTGRTPFTDQASQLMKFIAGTK